MQMSAVDIIDRIDDFVSVAEHGYRDLGDNAFETSYTSTWDVARYVVEPLINIDVDPADYAWGERGLVVGFKNPDDLMLFSLSFMGAR